MAKSTSRSKTVKLDVPTVRLGDVAGLLRLPPGVKDEKVKKGGKRIKTISITDIPEAGAIENVESSISLSSEKFNSLKKYAIQPFDVLMSIQGTVGTVGMVPGKFSGNWMANISLLVIRFEESKQENAVALTMFLKSDPGRKLIAKLQKGDTIKRINVKEFAAVQAPELTLEVIKESQEVFDTELQTLEKIEQLRSEMAEVRSSYLNS